MAKAQDLQKIKKSLERSDIRPLLAMTMLFQILACLLLAFRDSSVDRQTLILAGAMPLATLVLTKAVVRVWSADGAIVVFTMLLTSVGIITLTAIARSPETPRKQAEYALLGIAAFLLGIVIVRAYRPSRKMNLCFMILCMLALLSPWVLGRWNNGARNWVSVPGTSYSIQPSELMKPCFIVILASALSNRPRFRKTIPALAFAALCLGVLLSQHDLGAVLLFFLTTVTMFFAATSNGLMSLAGLGMGAGAGYIAYKVFPYVQDRFRMWKDPWSDPRKTGYQLVQSLIAIGSGGLLGMGLGLGSPRDIPLYHSDFIFAALTEEFGLIFSVCLLTVYVMLIMRGLIAAMNARTSFHSLTAFGIVTMLGFQTMLIVGGNTQLLPLTGVTLPLISSGGSSLCGTFFSIGVVCGISSMNRQDEMHDMELREISEEAMM